MTKNRRKAIKTINTRKQQKSTFKPVSNIAPEMSIYKIKDGYFFKSNNPKDHHFYITYTDKQSNTVRAIELTHLYNIDPTREKQLNKGLIYKESFSAFDTPSGVNRKYYTKNINGTAICLDKNKNKNILDEKINIIPESQALRILKKSNTPLN